MPEEDCSICGLDLKDKFCYQLKCSHEFHYECLMKTFISNPKTNKDNNNLCPYCRGKSDYLPIVNGLKKLIIGVHVNSINDCYDENGLSKNKNESCKYILKRGKNKGNECSKNCFLGYKYCKVHKNIMN